MREGEKGDYVDEGILTMADYVYSNHAFWNWGRFWDILGLW